MSENDDGSTARRIKSALAVLVALAVLGGGAWYAVTNARDALIGAFQAEDYPGPGEGEVVIDVPMGSSVAQIGGILEEEDVIASAEAFDQAARENPKAQNLQAGKYTLKKKMKASDALTAMLEAGVQDAKRITVIEGLRLNEQVAALSKQLEVPEDEVKAALEDPASYSLSGWAEGNPEGFLFPDTYDISGGDPKLAATLMAEQFTKVATDAQVEEKAKALGVSPRDVIIVASIIEAEVRRPEDRPKVARVLYNRLADGQPLQLDTTVEYANNKPRGQGATTTDEERANPSPYNTYVHPGLPPGPIGAPGRQAIEAAANPVPGNWRYFVAINLDTGETAFADTFEQHEQNVAKFQQWCQSNPGKC